MWLRVPCAAKIDAARRGHRGVLIRQDAELIDGNIQNMATTRSELGPRIAGIEDRVNLVECGRWRGAIKNLDGAVTATAFKGINGNPKTRP